jgi:hypothetical protein
MRWVKTEPAVTTPNKTWCLRPGRDNVVGSAHARQGQAERHRAGRRELHAARPRRESGTETVDVGASGTGRHRGAVLLESFPTPARSTNRRERPDDGEDSELLRTGAGDRVTYRRAVWRLVGKGRRDPKWHVGGCVTHREPCSSSTRVPVPREFQRARARPRRAVSGSCTTNS